MTDGIEDAEAFCKQHGHRFTDPRRHVLHIITTSHKPLSAYDILGRLGEMLNNPKPPTAYRAIEFWQKHGFIHRLESLNAYVACQAGHRHAGSQFMICEGCGIVIETHLCHLPQSLEKAATAQNFTPTRWSLELHGQCHNCA